MRFKFDKRKMAEFIRFPYKREKHLLWILTIPIYYFLVLLTIPLICIEVKTR